MKTTMAKIQESKIIIDDANVINRKTIKLPQLKELLKDVEIP